eukprot:gene6583-3235_t
MRIEGGSPQFPAEGFGLVAVVARQGCHPRERFTPGNHRHSFPILGAPCKVSLLPHQFPAPGLGLVAVQQPAIRLKWTAGYGLCPCTIHFFPSRLPKQQPAIRLKWTAGYGLSPCTIHFSPSSILPKAWAWSPWSLPCTDASSGLTAMVCALAPFTSYSAATCHTPEVHCWIWPVPLHHSLFTQKYPAQGLGLVAVQQPAIRLKWTAGYGLSPCTIHFSPSSILPKAWAWSPWSLPCTDATSRLTAMACALAPFTSYSAATCHTPEVDCWIWPVPLHHSLFTQKYPAQGLGLVAVQQPAIRLKWTAGYGLSPCTIHLSPSSILPKAWAWSPWSLPCTDASSGLTAMQQPAIRLKCTAGYGLSPCTIHLSPSSILPKAWAWSPWSLPCTDASSGLTAMVCALAPFTSYSAATCHTPEVHCWIWPVPLHHSLFTQKYPAQGLGLVAVQQPAIRLKWTAGFGLPPCTIHFSPSSILPKAWAWSPWSLPCTDASSGLTAMACALAPFTSYSAATCHTPEVDCWIWPVPLHHSLITQQYPAQGLGLVAVQQPAIRLKWTAGYGLSPCTIHLSPSSILPKAWAWSPWSLPCTDATSRLTAMACALAPFTSYSAATCHTPEVDCWIWPVPLHHSLFTQQYPAQGLGLVAVVTTLRRRLKRIARYGLAPCTIPFLHSSFLPKAWAWSPWSLPCTDT